MLFNLSVKREGGKERVLMSILSVGIHLDVVLLSMGGLHMKERPPVEL